MQNTLELIRMHGIILKDVVKHFGFSGGFNLWFRWSFIYLVKGFFYTYVTKHPLCLEHGFYWKCPEDCKAIKLTKRRDKIKYQKERKKQIDIEAKTIVSGPNGECAYCGMEPGTELIDDPNWNTLERWKVCKICKEVLDLQHDLNFYALPKISDKYPEKCQEINDKLSDISKKTGKPIMNCSVLLKEDGGYSVESVIFDGKKMKNEK
jgi:hypothetical protein